MLHSLLGRNRLRRRLDDVLRTDSDLNAFCIDYFPDVHRRFADGMDRIGKINLLLQLAPEPGKILDKLGAYSADHRKNGLCLEVALALTIAAIFAVAVGIYAHYLRHAAPSAENPTDSVATMPATGRANPLAAAINVNSGNVLDRSPEAEMHNRARMTAEKPPVRINSGNRIQGSRGAKMDNRVTVTP